MMTPFYERDGITIYCGDCLEVMPLFDPESFALIFVDWPYFKVKNELWDRQWDKPEQFLSWINKTLVQAKRLLKPNGSFYGCASPQMSIKVGLAIGKHFNVLNNIRWYKEAGWHQKTDKEVIRSYLSPWEAIIFAEQWFSDGSYQDRYTEKWASGFVSLRDYFRDYQEAIGLGLKAINSKLGHRKAEHSFYWNSTQWDIPTEEVYQELGDAFQTNGFLRREYEDLRREYEDLRREYEDLRREYEDLRRPFNGSKDTPNSDLWTFSPVSDYLGKHPTEKPIALLEHIIKTSTRSGDMILDFCMGNGTTLKAANSLGRKAVGIDITKIYCQQAAKLLKQMNLFSPDIIERFDNSKSNPVKQLPLLCE